MRDAQLISSMAAYGDFHQQHGQADPYSLGDYAILVGKGNAVFTPVDAMAEPTLRAYSSTTSSSVAPTTTTLRGIYGEYNNTYGIPLPTPLPLQTPTSTPYNSEHGGFLKTDTSSEFSYKQYLYDGGGADTLFKKKNNSSPLSNGMVRTSTINVHDINDKAKPPWQQQFDTANSYNPNSHMHTYQTGSNYFSEPKVANSYTSSTYTDMFKQPLYDYSTGTKQPSSQNRYSEVNNVGVAPRPKEIKYINGYAYDSTENDKSATEKIFNYETADYAEQPRNIYEKPKLLSINNVNATANGNYYPTSELINRMLYTPTSMPTFSQPIQPIASQRVDNNYGGMRSEQTNGYMTPLQQNSHNLTSNKQHQHTLPNEHLAYAHATTPVNIAPPISNNTASQSHVAGSTATPKSNTHVGNSQLFQLIMSKLSELPEPTLEEAAAQNDRNATLQSLKKPSPLETTTTTATTSTATQRSLNGKTPGPAKIVVLHRPPTGAAPIPPTLGATHAHSKTPLHHDQSKQTDRTNEYTSDYYSASGAPTDSPNKPIKLIDLTPSSTTRNNRTSMVAEVPEKLSDNANGSSKASAKLLRLSEPNYTQYDMNGVTSFTVRQLAATPSSNYDSHPNHSSLNPKMISSMNNETNRRHSFGEKEKQQTTPTVVMRNEQRPALHNVPKSAAPRTHTKRSSFYDEDDDDNDKVAVAQGHMFIDDIDDENVSVADNKLMAKAIVSTDNGRTSRRGTPSSGRGYHTVSAGSNSKLATNTAKIQNNYPSNVTSITVNQIKKNVVSEIAAAEVPVRRQITVTQAKNLSPYEANGTGTSKPLATNRFSDVSIMFDDESLIDASVKSNGTIKSRSALIATVSAPLVPPMPASTATATINVTGNGGNGKVRHKPPLMRKISTPPPLPHIIDSLSKMKVMALLHQQHQSSNQTHHDESIDKVSVSSSNAKPAVAAVSSQHEQKPDKRHVSSGMPPPPSLTKTTKQPSEERQQHKQQQSPHVNLDANTISIRVQGKESRKAKEPHHVKHAPPDGGVVTKELNNIIQVTVAEEIAKQKLKQAAAARHHNQVTQSRQQKLDDLESAVNRKKKANAEAYAITNNMRNMIAAANDPANGAGVGKTKYNEGTTNLPHLGGIDYIFKTNDDRFMTSVSPFAVADNSAAARHAALAKHHKVAPVPQHAYPIRVKNGEPSSPTKRHSAYADYQKQTPADSKHAGGVNNMACGVGKKCNNVKNFYETYSIENNRRKKEGSGFLMLLPGIAIPIDTDAGESDEDDYKDSDSS